MIYPEEFLDDHLRMLREGETIDDDLIRGACPANSHSLAGGHAGLPGPHPAQHLLGEERNLGWDQALAIRLDRSSAWYRKYMEFAEHWWTRQAAFR